MREWQLFRKAKNYNKILIYGAGMVGELVFRRLVENGLEDKILGFAVSQKGAQDIYLEMPVKCISEWPKDENTLVIIATLKNFHGEIEAVLRKHSYTNIIRVEDSLFRSMGRAYIKEFLEENPLKQGQIDIVFMASDNNSSSGAFLSMADLNWELNSHGISTIVILPIYGDGERILIEKGVNYTYIPSEDWLIEQRNTRRVKKIWRLLRNRLVAKRLCVFFSDHGVKLIHNNTTYTYVGAVAAHRMGIPVVWHLRENIWDQGYTFLSLKWAVRLLNRSAQLIFISWYMQSCIQGLHQEIIKVVYNGVNIDTFYREHKILEKPSEIRLLLPGRVVEYKGQKDMVEAAAAIKKKGDLCLTIDLIGKEDASYKQELEKLIEKYGLENIVYFWGKQNDVTEFYNRSDITVVCSAVEAFGRVTVEAQLAGCLVIGANAGATPELIQHRKTGLLYQKGNIEELADQIIWAAEHPKEAGEIAKNGQEYARGLYSKERNAQEIMNVYETILGKGWKENTREV